MKVFSRGNDGMSLKKSLIAIYMEIMDSHGDYYHRNVRVEQQFMGERRVEQSGEDVFLFVWHSDKIYPLLFFNLLEVVDNSGQTDVGSLEAEARIMVGAIFHQFVKCFRRICCAFF